MRPIRQDRLCDRLRRAPLYARNASSDVAHATSARAPRIICARVARDTCSTHPRRIPSCQRPPNCSALSHRDRILAHRRRRCASPPRALRQYRPGWTKSDASDCRMATNFFGVATPAGMPHARNRKGLDWQTATNRATDPKSELSAKANRGRGACRLRTLSLP